MTNKRVGYYCWSGPGTIRMINLKYFNPKINTKNVLNSYEYDYINQVKKIFGVTDFWATYSWGFSDKTEKEDREFLLRRIKNFKKNKIALHAYVQGTNLVYEEFENKDWWCNDNHGRLIPYHRGRRMTCVNNPEFREYISNKIEGLFNKGLDGIYVDNIFNGLLALPIYKNNLPVGFAGCACKYCQMKFKKQTGENIPANFGTNKKLTQEYLKFRVDSTTSFLKEIAKIVKKGKMEFGTNASNPHYSDKYFYGYDTRQMNNLQDYVLFEPVSFPEDKYRAIFSRIEEITTDFNKPTFIVAYKQHIGIDSEYSQKDFDLLFTEAHEHKFNLCIKGSEYFTNNTWHNLDIEKYSKPQKVKHKPHGISTSPQITNQILTNSVSRKIIEYGQVPVMQFIAENRFGRYIANNLAKH